MNPNLTPPPARTLPDTRRQQRKDQLVSWIQTEQQPRPRQHQLHRGWALAIGAATAAAVVAIAVVAILPAGRGGPSNAAAAVLNRLATRIAAHSWTPRPGQYLYLDTESEWGAFEEMPSGSCEIRSVERDQIWIGADGSGLDRETKQPGSFTSPTDRATCLSMTGQGATGVAHSLAARSSDDWSAPNCMGYGQNIDWSRFSTDPQTLLQQIDQRWHNTDATPSEQFDYIEQTLGQSNPPPDVVANIYRAAALIPGVQSLGTVQDHAGRSGLGLSLPRPGGTTEMIFDAETGELLGQTDTGPAGGWFVYFHKEIVNQLPADPPVPLTPACTITGSGIGRDIPGGTVMTGPSS